MEAYKDLLRKAPLPSLLFLIFTITTILIAYGGLSGSGGEILLIAFLGLAGVALFPLVSRRMALSAFSRMKGSAVNALLLLLLILLCILCGYFRVRSIAVASPAPFSGVCPWEGVVKELRLMAYHQEVVLMPLKVTGTGGTSLAVAYASRSLDLRTGDRLSMEQAPSPLSVDEGDGQGNFLNRSLLRRGISFRIHLREGNYRLIERGSIGWREELRRGIGKRIDLLFRGETAGMLKGLYFGNKNHIGKKTLFEFKRAGVMHILAASGAHVAVIGMIPMLILGAWRINRKIIYLVTVLLLTLYLCITDMPVSLQRAYIMFLAFLAQYLFDYDRNVLNALFLSALAILFLHPYEIYSLGFQLSFGATLGILLFYSLYRDVFTYLPAFLAGSLALTLSAQLIVFPVLFLQLDEVNTVAILSNVLVVPGIMSVLAASLGANALSFIWPSGARFLAEGIHHLYDAICVFVGFISGLRGHFTVGDKAPLLMIPFLLYLIPLIPLKRRRVILSLSVPISFVLAFYLLTGGWAQSRSPMLLETKVSHMLYLTGKGGDILYGDLGSRADAEGLVRYLNRAGVRDVRLMIPRLDYRNSRHFTYLARHLLLRECSLHSEFRLSPGMKSFFELLDHDGVPLKFADFREGKTLSPGLKKSLKRDERPSGTDDITQDLFSLIPPDAAAALEKAGGPDALSRIPLSR